METLVNCVSLETLYEVLNKNDIVIIDVRSENDYNNCHIPDTINIPFDELNVAMRYLDCNKIYITVCEKGGGLSMTAAKVLREAKFDTAWLCGGILGWFLTMIRKRF